MDLLCDESGWDSPSPVKPNPGVAKSIVSTHNPPPSEPRWPPPSDLTITTLLAQESDHMPAPDYIFRMQGNTMTIPSRTEHVEWILQISLFHHMSPRTAVLAVSYFDRFLSRYRMPNDPWVLHLAAVACLFIAAKMEEVESPSIPNLQVGLVVEFEKHCVERFELHVLATLSWRMKSTTPLSYLDYILHRMDLPTEHILLVADRCVEILLDCLREVRMLEFRPSIITLAIVRCAFLDGELAKGVDWERHLPSLCKTLKCPTDMVLRCQQMVQAVLLAPMLQKFWYPACSSDLVPCKEDLMSPTGVLESSSHFAGQKRAREDSPLPPSPKRRREDNTDPDILDRFEGCTEELNFF